MLNAQNKILVKINKRKRTLLELSKILNLSIGETVNFFSGDLNDCIDVDKENKEQEQYIISTSKKGKLVVETHLKDIRRVYIPLVISSVFSTFALVISIIALLK